MVKVVASNYKKWHNYIVSEKISYSTNSNTKKKQVLPLKKQKTERLYKTNVERRY